MSAENKPIIVIQNGEVPNDGQRQVYPDHTQHTLYNLCEQMATGVYNTEMPGEKLLHQTIKDLLSQNGQTK